MDAKVLVPQGEEFHAAAGHPIIGARRQGHVVRDSVPVHILTVAVIGPFDKQVPFIIDAEIHFAHNVPVKLGPSLRQAAAVHQIQLQRNHRPHLETVAQRHVAHHVMVVIVNPVDAPLGFPPGGEAAHPLQARLQTGEVSAMQRRVGHLQR